MLLLESHRTVTFRRAVLAATKYVKALTQIVEGITAYTNALNTFIQVSISAIQPPTGADNK